MSLGLIPLFKPKAAAKCSELGEAMAEALEALEDFAEDHGLVPLSAFADPREVPEDFDGGPEELDELLGPCKDWFDAKKGASAVEALLVALGKRKQKGIGAEVLKELEALKKCLAAAGKKKAKFRITLA